VTSPTTAGAGTLCVPRARYPRYGARNCRVGPGRVGNSKPANARPPPGGSKQ
jgi:hypothetical protein